MKVLASTKTAAVCVEAVIESKWSSQEQRNLQRTDLRVQNWDKQGESNDKTDGYTKAKEL